MKVAIDSIAENAEVIRELLSPWAPTYTTPEDSDIVIAYRKNPSEYSKSIVIPSNSACFDHWVKNAGLRARLLETRRKETDCQHCSLIF